MPRAGGIQERLTQDPGDDFSPVWSPDNKSLAFFSHRSGSRDIYIMNADGTDRQQITNDAKGERYPDWSPDGQHLAFFSDKTGRQEIYVVSRRNGSWGQPQQLTSSGALFPRWSPDGKTIAFIDSVNGLSVMSPDGKGVRHLVPHNPLNPRIPAWGNDNQTIYFKAGGLHGSLWSVSVHGGQPKHLVQFDDRYDSVRVEFDTDGKDLFFTMTERQSDISILQLQR
jgi:TolB protein